MMAAVGRETKGEIDRQVQLAINTLRFLAVDRVEKAKSGHPGAPLGCAPIIYLLFHETMKFNPVDPLWSGGNFSAFLMDECRNRYGKV